MKTFWICLAVFLTAVVSAQTKINVTLDHEDAMYKCNEQAVFTVSVMNGDQLHKEGKAAVRLSNDGLTTFMTKEIDLAAENPFTVTGTMEKSGVLSLDVDVAAQPKKLHKVFGAAFDPFNIQPGAPAPKDFIDFWRNETTLPPKLHHNPQLTPLPRLTNDKVEGFKVSLDIPSGHIYGFLTVPKAPGKYPAIISVPGAGPGATSAPMLEDFVYLVMNVHTYDPDIPGKNINDSYKELNKNGMYMYKGIPDREKTYFHHSIVGIYEIIRWLICHDKVIPTCIGYHGSSQGGAFGFILGGLDIRVIGRNFHLNAIVCNVPAMCDHLGYKQGRLAGWPQFCRQMKNSPEIESMAQYYDAMNFANLIPQDVPVRVIVGLADRTCSPSSVFAAYNQIPSLDKQIISEVGMGHEVWPSYHKQIAWLKGYLNEKKMSQWNKFECDDRLRQIYTAYSMFVDDNEGALPAEDKWQKSLYEYIRFGKEIFTCPENGKPYHYNRPAAAALRLKDPSRTILFYEDFDNHDGKVNIAFGDGHVQSYPVDGCKTIEELAKHHKLLLKGDEE